MPDRERSAEQARRGRGERPVDQARRPPRRAATDVVARRLRAAGWAVLAAGAALVAVRYPALPETVPIHFDFAGADRFGHKSSVLWLLLIGVALHALMAWLSTRPQILNYPVPVTDANAERLYREGERLMAWMGLTVAVAFAGIIVLVMGSGLGLALIVPSLVAMVVGAFVSFVRMSR